MVENENQMTMEDLDQIINDNPPGSPPPESSDTSANTEEQDNTAAGTSSETQSDTTDNSSESADNNQSKANAAFAEMRTLNRKMQDALAAVLQQHGKDPALAKNPERLIQDAENARLEAEAEKQKVPADLLKRLTQLEKTNMENERARLTNAALSGFQAVKQKYNLTNQDISNFAKQLQDAGTNPFEKEMDLDLHYRLHNLDKIIAAESQKAVEEALRNQKSATQHSTVPSKTQGKESTGVDKIDTMAQFDRFLMKLGKN